MLDDNDNARDAGNGQSLFALPVLRKIKETRLNFLEEV